MTLNELRNLVDSLSDWDGNLELVFHDDPSYSGRIYNGSIELEIVGRNAKDKQCDNDPGTETVILVRAG